MALLRICGNCGAGGDGGVKQGNSCCMLDGYGQQGGGACNGIGGGIPP